MVLTLCRHHGYTPRYAISLKMLVHYVTAKLIKFGALMKVKVKTANKASNIQTPVPNVVNSAHDKCRLLTLSGYSNEV